MKNYDIAVKWAVDTATESNKLMMSDQFFEPFGGVDTPRSLRLIRELETKNVLVWPGLKNEAYIVHRNNPRLKMSSAPDGTRGGAWLDDNNMLILGLVKNGKRLRV
jgi:hypothetical protein